MVSRAEHAEQIAHERFSAEDKQWTGPRFILLAIATLIVCLATIYGMSTTTGCSLQVVP